MKAHSNTSLKPFHTFGLDVHAKEIIDAQSPEDFLAIWRDDRYKTLPKLIVGEGSNLLFCSDFKGLVVLNRLKGISVSETDTHWHLHVAGGENWHELVRWTVEHNMPGLENLALIPGLVGSAPIQNIGAYGVELNDRCEYVDVLHLDSGDILRLSAKECAFGYRDSVFKQSLKHGHVIVAVGLQLEKAWEPVLGYGALSDLAAQPPVSAQAIFDKVCEIRSAKLPDPYVLGNAGSFFKNPVVAASLGNKIKAKYPEMPAYPAGDHQMKLAAGWLIEKAGLKGHKLGGAAVHEKQALVLINTGDASAQDVVQLAKHVVDTVYQSFGVELEHEVRFMGAEEETSLETVCQR
ncbi:UDP-N-acetylmuramate dehydrogenase [Enterovibrio baiacu]|uniref:UDP-N-acetylmuramate dehydrogenase n=1 Tax=Enterovibrio baiacu TaxID=2491023 RepID=UPI003D0D9CAB